MMKRSFFGTAKPRLEYTPLEGKPQPPVTVSPSQKVVLLFKHPYTPKGAFALGSGDKVKTGQPLAYFRNGVPSAVSPVTGTVVGFSPYYGDMGQSCTALTIEVSDKTERDDAFDAAAGEPSIETLKKFLSGIPGAPMEKLFPTRGKIHTVVVNGADTDLLLATNQFILKTRMAEVKKGMEVIRAASGAEKVVLVVPQHLMLEAGGVKDAIAAESVYPSANPGLLIRRILGKDVPAGKTNEDLGVCFMGAEAAAAIGKAFLENRVPVVKTLTFVDKAGKRSIVSAPIGTPIGDIFKAFGITLEDRDRIIVGGPMTGVSAYTEEYPVQPETDGLMIQGHADVSLVSDYPCVNCGDCIRVCPTRVPVNMLVRFLEAGQYEEGATLYDLHSCIECGLCSFVCSARIPIFQYIRLAKYELARVTTAEATNE